MLNFEVSVLPLLVVAFVNFFLSWFWYSPALFAKPWMKGLGIPEGREMTDQQKKEMPMLFAGGIIASFVLSYALQILVHSIGAGDFLQGMLVGLVAWFGFAITHGLNTLWEGRAKVVIVINLGLYLVTYLGFGGLIAVWR